MSLTTSMHPPVEEIIHGVRVTDPFRWLENRSLPETEGWISDQQQRCARYFSECGNLDSLRSKVCEYLDIEIVDQPSLVAGRYFYRRRDRAQEQACIYVRDVMTGRERLLVDPSKLGRFVSVGIYHISNDGSLLAVEIKQGGEDEKAICFIEVCTGRIMRARIESGYARGLAFTSGKEGFYYCLEHPTTSKDHTILLHHFHKSDDDKVLLRLARSRGSRLVLMADAEHLGAIWIHEEASELVMDLFLAKRGKPSSWKQVLVNKALPYKPMLKHGKIFALSFEGAPNGKLVELNDDGREIQTVISEQDEALMQVVFAGGQIFTNHLKHTIPSIQRWTLAGKNLEKLSIPLDGTIHLLSNQAETESSLFYTYESFLQRPTIFEYKPDATQVQCWHDGSKIGPGSHFVQHASFRSKDGTRVPMKLVGLGTRNRGADTPVIMTSYGGFGVSMTPRFSVLVTIMMELGVMFALPQIRGGGEFGKDWQEAARGQNRQVAFDDFIAAAEWLCDRGMTQPEHLAIFGGSNSGLLVSAAFTQRPDLFCAVLCMAPLLDMVRYERFDQAAKWCMEYGSVNNSKDFHALYAYSPYHRIANDCNYPPVLFVTGDKDERCNPAHVRKMAARLQERDVQTHTVLVDYSFERGHSPVMPLSVRTDALVRRIAFLCRELKIPNAVGGPHEASCD
jgi:prolyl oligopeptidase